MRLTAKLITIFMLGNVVLAAIYGYLAVQREVRLFEQNAAEEAQRLGRALDEVLAETWLRSGFEGMLDVVRKASHEGLQQTRIRWVNFDSQPGDPFSPAVPAEQLTTVAIEQHLVLYASDVKGSPTLRIYWPVHLKPERKGGLEFSRTLAELDEHKADTMRRMVLLIGGMVLLSGLLAAVLGVHMVGRPLRDLIEKTRRMAGGDLQGPIDLRSHDELAELADSLNGMCAQLAASQKKIQEEAAARVATMEQLRHADRLKTVGRLAGGIAHELGTPLNVVSGRAGLIESGKLSPDEINQSAAAIRSESNKMTRIIRQLLDFARRNAPHKAAIDLRALIRQTVDLLDSLATARNVSLDFAISDEPPLVAADAGQIQQVLTNLIVNAIQALPDGGPVEITIGRRMARGVEAAAGGLQSYCVIEVKDQGVGITTEDRPHLFEPFFTTKKVGEGTGLGLSIAYGIVQEHGGWIDVASRPGEGSCFTVFLPAEDQS